MIYFTIFTIFIVCLMVFNDIYVKISLHVTVPLRKAAIVEWRKCSDMYHNVGILISPMS